MCQRALELPGCSVHWSGKAEVKNKRKVGHITIVADSAQEALVKVRKIQGVEPAATPAAPLVGIIMGSDSDLPCMRAAADQLESFGVPYEITIVSAHRTPQRMFDYAKSAPDRGIKVCQRRCCVSACMFLKRRTHVPLCE